MPETRSPGRASRSVGDWVRRGVRTCLRGPAASAEARDPHPTPPPVTAALQPRLHSAPSAPTRQGRSATPPALSLHGHSRHGRREAQPNPLFLFWALQAPKGRGT